LIRLVGDEKPSSLSYSVPAFDPVYVPLLRALSGKLLERGRLIGEQGVRHGRSVPTGLASTFDPTVSDN